MVVKAITGPGICNATTSALTTIKGTIPTRWCLFDYVEDGINNLSDYIIRRSEMLERVHSIVKADPELKNRIWVIPSHIVNSVEEVNELELHYLEQGYEGIILRDPCGQYKYGRTTVNEGSYLRVKRFMDTEIRITHVIEGATNNNEKTKDPNGYAERSTHAENMVPNGRVGTICGIALETLEFGGKVIIREGDEIEVGAGKLSHSERAYYFENQSEIIGKIGKYQFFPIGIKDKPRFPTFQCFRDPLDMG
jgi:DNA ligase-1